MCDGHTKGRRRSWDYTVEDFHCMWNSIGEKLSLVKHKYQEAQVSHKAMVKEI